MPSDPQRLAAYVRRARLNAGLTQREAADAAGIAKGTWGRIERGLGELRELSLYGVDRALGWVPGSAAAVAAGGEPRVARDEVDEVVVDNVVAEFRTLYGRVPAEHRARVADLVRGIVRTFADGGDKNREES